MNPLSMGIKDQFDLSKDPKISKFWTNVFKEQVKRDKIERSQFKIELLNDSHVISITRLSDGKIKEFKTGLKQSLKLVDSLTGAQLEDLFK
jgi:hypothetical protein